MKMGKTFKKETLPMWYPQYKCQRGNSPVVS